jgi:hypothetical protein
MGELVVKKRKSKPTTAEAQRERSLAKRVLDFRDGWEACKIAQENSIEAALKTFYAKIGREYDRRR